MKLINYLPANQKKMNEELEDLKAPLPSQLVKFLDKTVAIVKKYNLPRKKEILVIAKIVDSLGMNKQELQMAIQKIKGAGVLQKENSDVKKKSLNEAFSDTIPGDDGWPPLEIEMQDDHVKLTVQRTKLFITKKQFKQLQKF